LEAAESVCDADLDVFDGHVVLVDHHLIRQVEQAVDTSRFTMLETIRAYGQEQLRLDADWSAVAQRHAAFVVQLVEWAAAALWGPQEVHALERLEREIDNLRVAWTWLEQHDADAAALRARLLHAQGTMRRYWHHSGRIGEGQRRIQALLAVGTPPPSARAAALNALGLLATDLHDTEVARARHQEALAVARAANDRTEECRALWGLGRVAQQQEPIGADVVLLGEALAIARTLADPPLLCEVLVSHAGNLFAAGELERGTSLLHEALQVARDHGSAFWRHSRCTRWRTRRSVSMTTR
jgi:non-specific serine/threonine protein kinase